MNSTAALFPGGGSQYVGMGKELYDNYSAARQIFSNADEILGYPVSRLCFAGELKTLSKMQFAQPAIFVVSFAYFKVFNDEYGFRPQYFAGHSLGEYTAMTAAGVIDFAEALRLVSLRGQLLEEAGTAGDLGMVAVNKLSFKQVERILAHINVDGQCMFIAVANSSHQFVVSGYRKNFEELQRLVALCGGSAEALNIDTASHCPLLQNAKDSFADTLRKAKFRVAATNVISNVSGLPYTPDDDLAEILAQQMVTPVLWYNSMNYLLTKGVDTIVESGPNIVLKNLNKYINKELFTYSLDERADWDLLKVKYNKYSHLISHCLKTAVTTKNMNPDIPQDQYDDQVAKPFQFLKQIYEDCQVINPTRQDALKALTLLRKILSGKNFSDEQTLHSYKEMVQALA